MPLAFTSQRELRQLVPLVASVMKRPVLAVYSLLKVAGALRSTPPRRLLL